MLYQSLQSFFHVIICSGKIVFGQGKVRENEHLKFVATLRRSEDV